MLKPIKVVVTITWNNGTDEETELDTNEALEIKHKGSILSVRGEEKVDEEDEEHSG